MKLLGTVIGVDGLAAENDRPHESDWSRCGWKKSEFLEKNFMTALWRCVDERSEPRQRDWNESRGLKLLGTVIGVDGLAVGNDTPHES